MGTPAPGQRFGRYAVEAPVARGGMGVVFRARDVTRDRPVAHEIMIDGGGPESKPRFLREARLAASEEGTTFMVGWSFRQ